MKTKTWILLLSGVFLISLLGSFLVLRRQPDAALAEVSSGGKVVKTVNLRENQQFTITSKNGGKNVVVFIVPPDISKADKPQGFGDRVPDSRQAANLSSKYIAN